MERTRYPNIVEFELWGDYALFSDPVMRLGGEKCSYQLPTYEAMKGVLHSIYWKPTITWVVDALRVVNPIQMEVKGIRPIKYRGGNDLAYYSYLKDCRYQVRAHFEWNLNRPELAADRNENKHHQIALRMLRRGGRRDVFLGTRECQGYVRLCAFGEGEGAYDDLARMDFGLMYHGITYADEAYDEATRGGMTAHFWRPTMERGVVNFPRPQDCPHSKFLREMQIKPFGEEWNNFSGLKEFGEVR